MQKANSEKLVKLLQELKRDNLAPPNTPYEIWKELAALVPWPAVEVLVTKTGKDFLLTYRKDDYWDSWHIPGGFMGIGESIEDTCNRIAKKELGVSAKLQRVLTAQVWKNHPLAISPVSILCVCTTKENPKEGRFFKKIPPNTIPVHQDLMKAFLKNLH